MFRLTTILIVCGIFTLVSLIELGFAKCDFTKPDHIYWREKDGVYHLVGVEDNGFVHYTNRNNYSDFARTKEDCSIDNKVFYPMSYDKPELLERKLIFTDQEILAIKFFLTFANNKDEFGNIKEVFDHSNGNTLGNLILNSLQRKKKFVIYVSKGQLKKQCKIYYLEKNGKDPDYNFLC